MKPALPRPLHSDGDILSMKIASWHSYGEIKAAVAHPCTSTAAKTKPRWYDNCVDFEQQNILTKVSAKLSGTQKWEW